MKVLYGVQCTGNGHITRSIALIEELRKYVHVDVLTSGSHSEVEFPFEVKYKKKGLTYFFGKSGGFDLWKTLYKNNLFNFYRELRSVPTHLYDVVITDFEPLTAWSAKQNWVYSAEVSNQASLLNPKLSLPEVNSPVSKLFLKYFCPSKKKYSLAYKKIAEELYYPPIRESIKRLDPINEGHYLVYLPSFSDEKIINRISSFKNEQWIVFSKHTTRSYAKKNVIVKPIKEEDFLVALESCKGVLCNAGFGTTSEALFLKKKLLVVPMKNQYEQLCNAHMLEEMGFSVMKSLKKKHHNKLKKWILSSKYPSINLIDETERLARIILEDYVHHHNSIQLLQT